MTGYGVKIVNDDLLPEGAEWMFVKMKCGELHLWLARSVAGSARVLAEAWAAYRAIERDRRSPVPRQSTRVVRIP